MSDFSKEWMAIKGKKITGLKVNDDNRTTGVQAVIFILEDATEIHIDLELVGQYEVEGVGLLFHVVEPNTKDGLEFRL